MERDTRTAHVNLAFNRIVAARAMRLGQSVEDVLGEVTLPKFMQAATAEAQRRNCTVQQVLAGDMAALEKLI